MKSVEKDIINKVRNIIMSVLGPVKPYFKYAMDLQKISPEVAYYCKFYGVNKGLELMRKAGGDQP